MTVVGFASPGEMLRHYKYHPDNISYAVEFNVISTATSLPMSLHYSLRPKMEDWETDSVTSFSGSNSPRDGEPGESEWVSEWVERVSEWGSTPL